MFPNGHFLLVPLLPSKLRGKYRQPFLCRAWLGYGRVQQVAKPAKPKRSVIQLCMLQQLLRL